VRDARIVESVPLHAFNVKLMEKVIFGTPINVLSRRFAEPYMERAPDNYGGILRFFARGGARVKFHAFPLRPARASPRADSLRKPRL